MAAVIHLAEGEHPPEKKACVVVLRDTAGGYFVLSSTDSYQREVAPSSYPVVDAERSSKRYSARVRRLSQIAKETVAVRLQSS